MVFSSVRQNSIQGYMVNNSTPRRGVQEDLLSLYCYACTIASTFQCCIVKNSFYAGVLKMPTSSPRAVREGGFAEVLPYAAASSLLCFMPLLYAQVESVGVLST